MTKEDCILFSGGAQGAEAEFGINAERFGIEEVNFTFEGHKILRHRGLRVLNHEELKAGDVSMEYLSRLMNRPLYRQPGIPKNPPEHLASDQQWAGDLCHWQDSGRQNRKRRHRMGRRIRQALQQTTPCLRSGTQPMVRLERRQLD